jgi:iron-sulfur cluster repair protein YtfE (RIC family)
MIAARHGALSDSVTEILGADHRRLDAQLADVKRCLAAGSLREAAERFAAFRSGLERHIDVEEEVLFPVLERVTGTADAGPTHVLRAEHAELRRLMDEIAANLERDACRATPLAALTARIYAHNGKEERILYPALDEIGGAVLAQQVMLQMESSDDS